jgi:hypothetical protein
MTAIGIPVLTLHQPWATLIALGVKTIETRGQGTKVRGRIAIHAAKQSPGRWYICGNDEMAAWAYDGWALGRVTDGVAHMQYHMPLGAIVATANLVDSVPMLTDDDWRPRGGYVMLDGYGHAKLWPDGVDISDQVPYGDFRPGRWAWILDDIQPLAQPVQFKGGQGWSRRVDPTVLQ